MSTCFAALLLSRQALRPCASTPWVQQTLQALDWIQSEPLTLISSVGMPTWELILAAARLRQIPQIILIPAPDTETFIRLEDRIRRDFDLKPDTLCRPVFAPHEKQALMHARDRAALDLASILIPISLRPDGFMAQLLDQQRSRKTVIDHFTIPYEPGEHPLKYTVDTTHLNPGLDELPLRYLIHWTRAANSPWPDERPLDYYQSLLCSDTYPRTAVATLRHILATRTLRASDRHMPLATKTVAFSGLLPRHAIPLMRWRARYCEMSFEPYAVGIEQSTAHDMGIEPVLYYDPIKGGAPGPDNLWRSQSIGVRSDWTRENEFRHRGDIDLGAIPADRVLAFCCYPHEAGQIVKSTGFDCMSLLSQDP